MHAATPVRLLAGFMVLHVATPASSDVRRKLAPSFLRPSEELAPCYKVPTSSETQRNQLPLAGMKLLTGSSLEQGKQRSRAALCVAENRTQPWSGVGATFRRCNDVTAIPFRVGVANCRFGPGRPSPQDQVWNHIEVAVL